MLVSRLTCYSCPLLKFSSEPKTLFTDVAPPNHVKVLRSLNSVLSLSCDLGYGFVDGSTIKAIPSSIACKTFSAWVDPSDPYSQCYR